MSINLLNLESNGILQKIHLQINAKISLCLKNLFNINFKQLIVCGFPRSGTSLLYNMISSSLEGFHFGQFETYFIHRIHRLGSWATKAPMDIFHIKHIERLNVNHKNLIILIMVRDIRDILTSRHPMHPEEYFIGYDNSYWPQSEKFNNWRYVAPGILDIHNEIQSIIKSRPEAFIIKYENLVDNPDFIQNKISQKFKNLRFTSQFSTYHKRPGKHAYKYEGRYAPKDPGRILEDQKASKARVNRWEKTQDQANRIKRQFTECPELFSILEEYGYENSRSWFDNIFLPK